MKRFLITLPHLLLAAMLLGLGACASAPPPRLLSLPLPPASATQKDAPAPAASRPPAQGVLAVRRVNLPEYLHSDKVRFRAADSLLAEWPDVVWAERLDSSMTEQLVLRLRAALPQWHVCERACPATPASATLTVDLTPLDYVRRTGALQAFARWQLWRRPIKARDEATAISGERGLHVPVTPDSAEGQATAMAHVLDEVAQGIAADVRQMEKDAAH